MEYPDLVLEMVPLDILRLDTANPRRMTEAEYEALTRSMRQFGCVDPIIARRADGMVIGGHQRLVVARRLGMTTVPVIFVDLSLDRARLLNLALNRVQGDWDPDLLARLLIELQQAPEIDLRVSGFGDDEIAGYLRALDAGERRDRAEQFELESALDAARREPRTQPGDLIKLGPHVLMCGDSTQADHVERLVGTAPAAMAFTDPPYNVDYMGGRGARRRRIANDALTSAEWEAFLAAWSAQLSAHVAGAWYVCMSSRESPRVSQALAASGGHWSDTIIWSKDRFTMGRADYQRQYELIWYGWREGAQRQWHGGRSQGDIWAVDRPGTSPLHPTMKPLPLIERAIENSSTAGDRVLDLFMGSGSTLIACERTNRRCVGMEIDPHYCDVILARWEAFSGVRAETAPADSLEVGAS